MEKNTSGTKASEKVGHHYGRLYMRQTETKSSKSSGIVVYLYCCFCDIRLIYSTKQPH